MASRLKDGHPGRIIGTTVMLILGILILYVSMVRAGLEIMAQDNNENKLRVKPVVFNIFKDEKPVEYVYKMPEVTTLPSNYLLYKIKYIRDNLWIYLSHNPIDKTKITLLIADKKMTESLMLYGQNSYVLALDSGEEAFNKLKYANEAVLKSNKESIETKQLKTEIFKAGFAYKEVLNTINQDKKLDQKKFQKLIEDIDKWNEEKRKENLEI